MANLFVILCVTFEMYFVVASAALILNELNHVVVCDR